MRRAYDVPGRAVAGSAGGVAVGIAERAAGGVVDGLARNAIISRAVGVAVRIARRPGRVDGLARRAVVVGRRVDGVAVRVAGRPGRVDGLTGGTVFVGGRVDGVAIRITKRAVGGVVDGLPRRAIISRAVRIAARIAVRTAHGLAGRAVITRAVGDARGRIADVVAGIRGDGVSARTVVSRAVRKARGIAAVDTGIQGDRGAARTVIARTVGQARGVADVAARIVRYRVAARTVVSRAVDGSGRIAGRARECVAGGTTIVARSGGGIVGAGCVARRRAGIAHGGTGIISRTRCALVGVRAHLRGGIVGAVHARTTVAGIGCGIVGVVGGACIVAQAGGRVEERSAGRADVDAIAGGGAVGAARNGAGGRERDRIVGRGPIVRVVAVRRRERGPCDVSRAAQPDAAGPVAIAVGRVVAARDVGAGVARHQVSAVQEVAVLVDPQAEIATDQAVVRRVGVRARVRETAAPGSEAGRLLAVLQEEAYAVRAVCVRGRKGPRPMARIAMVGDCLEGHLKPLVRGECAGRQNRAPLIVAVLLGARDVHGAIGEAQRAVPRDAAVRVRDHGIRHLPGDIRGRRARSQVAVVAAHHVRIGVRREIVITPQHGGAAGYQAGIRAGSRRPRGQARAAEVVPVVDGRRGGEVFTAEGRFLGRARAGCKQRDQQEADESQPAAFSTHGLAVLHIVGLFEVV